MPKSEIYKMGLHKELLLPSHKDSRPLKITRVSGGWIYTLPCRANEWQAVFVPYNNEFDGLLIPEEKP